MSKENLSKEPTGKTEENVSPLVISKVSSRLPIGTVSRIQPKMLTGFTHKGRPTETTETSNTTLLPEEVQTKMENSFDQDFSNINIHQDSSSAQEINAKAYTQGADIHFAPGEYNPASKEGQELIGHELTHVVQQGQGRVGNGEIHGKGLEINQDASLEKEADDAGKLASEGKNVEVMKSAERSVQKKEDNTISLEAGSLALYGEGNMSAIRSIHWPGGISGVTLGKGYDMGARSEESIVSALTNAGVSEEQATKISKAAKLKGEDANKFVIDNKTAIGTISEEAVLKLFQAEWPKMREQAKSVATNTKADSNNSNARGREIKDDVEAGTYVMSSQEWDSMHPALIDFITDLKFHGGYYLYDRVAAINKAVKTHPNDQLGQLKAVRELFTNGYIETYTEALGFTKYKTEATETFYGKEVQMKDKFRRDEIRLTYLNVVIEALESNKKVEIKGLTNAGTKAPMNVPKVDIISESVGLAGKNKVEDVIKVQQLLYKAGYNLSINGKVDQETISFIKNFQSVKMPGVPPDGLITPGKNTIKCLKEYSESERVKPIAKKEGNAVLAPKENLILQAFENYKNGSITMVTLGSKMKENNWFFPTTALNVFKALPVADRDNLAYTMANQSSDGELRGFNIEVLKYMNEALGTYIYTTNWTENFKQQERIKAVLDKQTQPIKKVPVAETQDPNRFSGITSVGTDMLSEKRYYKGRAYFDTKVGDKTYKSGELIEGSVNTWCNQFAMDLARKVTKDDPFKDIPGGQGNATVSVMLTYMAGSPALFQELKKPFHEIWENEINNGQLVFFIEPSHISTGILTSKDKFETRTDLSGKKWTFGEVVQAGKSTNKFALNYAWGVESFKNLRCFKYLGK